MNNKNIRQFEISLGLVQLVIVVGAILGSLACSFYLGFFSGQSAGFERAIVNTASTVPVMPIPGSDLSPTDDIASQVYAKLSDDLGSRSREPGVVPPLEPIPDMASAPLLAGGTIQESAESGTGTAMVEPKKDDFFGDLVPVPAAESDQKPTLGALLQAREAQPDGTKGSASGSRAPEETARVAPAIVAKESEKRVVSSQTDQPVKAAAQPAKVVESATANKKPMKPESLIRKIIPSGWYAQIAAPKRVVEAESMAQKLQKGGFPVMIESANVRGQEYFRVIVGPEGTRERAERLVAQIRREGIAGGDPFVRMVK